MTDVELYLSALDTLILGLKRKASEQISTLRVSRRRAGYALLLWRATAGAMQVKRILHARL